MMQAVRADGMTATGVNCTHVPYFCREPFNCHKVPTKATIATADGHADYSGWCDGNADHFARAAVSCAAGDLSGYGRIIHQAQLSIQVGPVSFGKTVEGLDAHYCFAFGHCDNKEVTTQTTLREAEAMCDRRFGHEHWTQISKANLSLGPDHIKMGWHGMYFDETGETDFAEMACAMGNYHCDVIYCQQEYCSKQEFIDKYTNERPEVRRAIELRARQRREKEEAAEASWRKLNLERKRVAEERKAARKKLQEDRKQARIAAREKAEAKRHEDETKRLEQQKLPAQQA